MNDNEIFAAVRDSLTAARDSLGEVRMERPARTFEARARKRRLRRGLSGAATGTLALGVGLALALTAGGSPALTAHSLHANLAAWSVNTNSNGTVTLVVRDLRDPAQLEHKLAEVGIPSVVYFGEFCYGQPVPGWRTDRVLQTAMLHRGSRGSFVEVTLTPSAMPEGAELMLSIPTPPDRGGPPGQSASRRVPNGAGIALIRPGSPVTCTTAPPDHG